MPFYLTLIPTLWIPQSVPPNAGNSSYENFIHADFPPNYSDTQWWMNKKNQLAVALGTPQTPAEQTQYDSLMRWMDSLPWNDDHNLTLPLPVNSLFDQQHTLLYKLSLGNALPDPATAHSSDYSVAALQARYDALTNEQQETIQTKYAQANMDQQAQQGAQFYQEAAAMVPSIVTAYLGGQLGE